VWPWSYETVRRWVNHFGPMIAAHLRKRRLKPHTTWYLDEVYLKIGGRMVYLWRAVDRRRGPRCAGPAQAKQARRPETDAQAPEEVCLRSRAVGHRRLPVIRRSGARSGIESLHQRGRWKNNRAKNSHLPTQRRERKMQRSRAPAQPRNSFQPMRPSTTVSAGTDSRFARFNDERRTNENEPCSAGRLPFSLSP
jgi:putative transposase